MFYLSMKIKDIILGIAIIILTIFVTFYGINTFFPKSQYEDFCGEPKSIGVIETLEQCEAVGGKWADYDIVAKPSVEGERVVEGYCDRDYECRQELEDANRMRSRNVFFIALPLGIIIIILGAFLFKLDAVGAGLMGGGVGTLIYGAGAYWPYSENWIRFLISLIGLVILIWFVYYFNKKLSGK